MANEFVRDVMTRSPRTLPADETVSVAARLMEAEDVGEIIVTDQRDVCGVVTDRDITVRAVAHGMDPVSTSVRDICSEDPVTVESATSLITAAEVMRDHAIRRLPVVDNGQLVGVVSLGDLAMEKDPRSALGQISAAPPNR
jgi:CBS domain-containing protein